MLDQNILHNDVELRHLALLPLCKTVNKKKVYYLSPILIDHTRNSTCNDLDEDEKTQYISDTLKRFDLL